MLVISRKVNETFIIGDNITVRVLEISGDKIKIGIDAPKDIKIMRSEIAETENVNREAQNIPSKIDESKVKALSEKIFKKKLKND